MQWDDRFTIGIASIDAQHREMIKLLNQLQSALKKGGDKKIFANTIRALVDYTRYHFSDEERYMQSIRYPSFETHRKMHEKLIGDVKKILINLKHGIVMQEISLLRFLNDWVCNHIIEEDLKIGRFVQHNRIIGVPGAATISSAKEEVKAEFESLSNQREHGVLPDNEFIVKCGEILGNHPTHFNLATRNGLSDSLSMIAAIFSGTDRREIDRSIVNTVLLRKALSQNITAAFDSRESLLIFLKSMKRDQQISDDVYETIATEISSPEVE